MSAQMDIQLFLTGWVCDLCGAHMLTEFISIKGWKGCCEEWTKAEFLAICHECASKIRNLCWQIEANQAQRCKEVKR